MFEKSKLKKQLNEKKNEIEELEKKRYRSQAMLVEAILKNEAPNDEEVEYFNRFTDAIDGVRSEIAELQRRIDEM